jgi:anti-sigma factor RsiW
MCPTSQELSAYHDGALDAARAGEIDAHVRSCAACRDELTDLRRVSDWLRASPRAEPSPEAVQRVVAFADGLAVAEDEAPTYGRLRRIGRVLTGVAATVLAFGVLRLSQQAGPGARTSSTGVAEEWETVAVQGETSGATGEAQFADWIVSGLGGASR